MALVNYTEDGEIIIGSRWPAFTGTATWTLTYTPGWPIGAESWIWSLRFSKRLSGGTPALSVDADSVSRDDLNTALILNFILTESNTNDLSPGKNEVDIRSNNSGTISVHDGTQGYARVRNMAGDG